MYENGCIRFEHRLLTSLTVSLLTPQCSNAQMSCVDGLQTVSRYRDSSRAPFAVAQMASPEVSSSSLRMVRSKATVRFVSVRSVSRIRLNEMHRSLVTVRGQADLRFIATQGQFRQIQSTWCPGSWAKDHRIWLAMV